jgi:ATP-dependent helicase HepA
VLLEAAADPVQIKIDWLVGLLKELKKQKVLLICHSRELAVEVLERLQRIVKIPAAVFHEGLTLLQRDRNAAFFAEEDGARLLVCSEIGSEGRNFQFAHHLVLFDVPENPELLEQRIGRLDRIGQTSTIHIHVPVIEGSPEAFLTRWYQEGLDAFQKHPHGAPTLMEQFRERLAAVSGQQDEKKFQSLVSETVAANKSISKRLQLGHDRLLEIHSRRPELALPLIEAIRKQDDDQGFEAFFIRMLDHLGVEVEELGSRSYLLRSGASQNAALPGLAPEGAMFTFERARALAREDVGFLTPDHPLVQASLDALLGIEAGNSVFGVWRSGEADGILLEIHFVIECVAPPGLHADRFLPATPVRVVVDQTLGDRSDDDSFRAAEFEKGDVFRLLDTPVFKKKHLPAMLAKATEIAGKRKESIVQAAAMRANEQLKGEIERLEDLRRINPSIRNEEITGLQELKNSLLEAFASATVRTDALKLVLRLADK